MTISVRVFLVVSAKPTLNSLRVKGKCVRKTGMTVGRSRCEQASGRARSGAGTLHLWRVGTLPSTEASFLHVAGNAILMSSELLVSTAERK